MKTILKITKYFLLSFFILIIGFCALNYYGDISMDEMKAKYANAESEFIEIEGMLVHYRDEGNPADSIPIVLIHGTGASLHTWNVWTEKLKKTHRVIRLDLPAYGLTGPNKNHDYSSKYYISFLHDFLRKLNVKSCYMAGNSLGGKITWDYALQYPNEINKMILIDAAGYPSKKLGGALVFKLAQLPYIKHIFTKVTPKFIIEKSMLDVYGDDSKVNQQLIDQYHDMARREGNREAFVSRTKIKFDENYKRISEIKTPTLLLWGELDNWITIDNAYQFQKDLPNDTLIIYKGVGHIPMEEIPVKTAEDALIFLEK